MEVLPTNIKSILRYFTKGEWALWLSSMAVIVVCFCIFDRSDYLVLAASLLGATFLILNAKGNPLGQFLVIVFSVFYGYISYTFSYYGEMVTYLGMTAPMAALALIAWLKNPYQGNSAEVTVNQVHRKEVVLMLLLTAIVTVVFYYILGAFHTANLIPSTISVTTSFIAAYLTFRRSPFFCLAYASNDAVLVVLWVLAAREDPSYLSMVVCFIIFFINDMYGFINWMRMQKRQQQAT